MSVDVTHEVALQIDIVLIIITRIADKRVTNLYINVIPMHLMFLEYIGGHISSYSYSPLAHN